MSTSIFDFTCVRKSITVVKMIILAAVFALLSVPSCLIGNDTAYADELSDTKKKIERQVEKMADLSDAIKAKKKEIAEIQGNIDEKAEASAAIEESIAKKQQIIDELSVFFYKNPTPNLLGYVLEADDISEVIARAEFLFARAEDLAKAADAERSLTEELQNEIDEISAQKDEQNAVIKELRGKKNDLQAIIDELEAKKEKLEEEQRARLAAATQARNSVADTFESDLSDGGWQTGQASAYGGSTDSAGSITATGARVTEYSLGVAVPMNQRQYLNRKLEISYNGKSVIAVCNDVGGFGKYGRALDLQIGVCRALGGVSSCNGWGVRTVKYRWL